MVSSPIVVILSRIGAIQNLGSIIYTRSTIWQKQRGQRGHATERQGMAAEIESSHQAVEKRNTQEHSGSSVMISML